MREPQYGTGPYRGSVPDSVIVIFILVPGRLKRQWTGDWPRNLSVARARVALRRTDLSSLVDGVCPSGGIDPWSTPELGTAGPGTGTV